MALFRRTPVGRSPGRQQAAAITAFWTWWGERGAGETAAAIQQGEPERTVDAMSRHVQAIDKGLAWELNAGSVGRHVLVVSSEGNPQLRPVARRWRLAAPPADDVWEYSDTRLPARDPAGTQFTIGDVRLDLAAATVFAMVNGATVDVSVHHPAFASIPEQARTLATFLMLDTVLGEAAVETWIGTVEPSTIAALDPVPLTGLRTVVRELTQRFTDGAGRPVWMALEGQAQDGSKVVAGVQVPLRAATAPHLDTYAGMVIPFTDSTPDGLPTEDCLRALADLQRHLAERLGDSGRVVAHETSRGFRILHTYLDGTTPAAEQLRVAVGGWQQGSVQLSVAPDPGWTRVEHLRV